MSLPEFRAALREEFSAGTLAFGTLLVGGLSLLGDPSPAYLLGIVGAGIFAGVGQAASEAALVDDLLYRVALGVVIAVAGVGWGWARLRTGESPVPPAFAVLVGCWLALDGATAYRAGFSTDPPPLEFDDGALNAGRTMFAASKAFDLLDADQPRTVSDVAAAVDLDRSHVENGLSLLEHQGIVERRADGYVANPEYRGRNRPSGKTVRRALRRLVRPYRLLSR